MLSPYRVVCDPAPSDLCGGVCADVSGLCDTGPPRLHGIGKFAIRAAVLTAAIICAGTLGAATYAVLAVPSPPIELGPAAIAKLRRPFPGLMGYGYESHDPYELRKRAIDLVDHHYDISVTEVRLSDTAVSRLRHEKDDLSGLEPVIDNGKLTSVRVRAGTPLAHAIGLLPGDEISAINGWPVPLIDDQILHSERKLAVLEVSRNGSPMVFCVSWR
jgi:hypothetical protein